MNNDNTKTARITADSILACTGEDFEGMLSGTESHDDAWDNCGSALREVIQDLGFETIRAFEESGCTAPDDTTHEDWEEALAGFIAAVSAGEVDGIRADAYTNP